MNKSESIAKLSVALVAAQSEMGAAKKSAKNPFFNSKYANLEEVIHVVKEAFSNHGLCFVQFPISSEGHAGVETVIIHNSGEFISNEFLLKCAKSDPQGMGSAITYARRYGLQSAAGIPSEDDDGNAASAPEPAQTKAQAIASLAAASTLAELSAAWVEISVDNKKNADVIGLKNARKSELTTN